MVAERQERRGLGRGLSALMADVGADIGPESEAGRRRAESRIPIDRIDPNPDQPRRSFGEPALEDLADSIRSKGIIQPLILRKSPDDPARYQIVAGERRWRAAQMAQLHDVPAIVRDLNDTEVLEVAIIENIQRSDLNAVDEAAGYQALMTRFGHTQEQLGEALGKSRSHIANLLRLLSLPEDVQGFVADGRLTAGHARALVTSDNASEIARDIIRKGLSVREVERLVKRPLGPVKAAAPRAGRSAGKDADTLALEEHLSSATGMIVTIDHPVGNRSGSMTVTYATLEQLDELCALLTGGNGES
ncbi:chromosome partitioning protein parB [Oceaniovalibus guishaninsula JLT2003]|uniref:Chromosome partitioning protein parB n=1 Tax=Oceaniovalibus guishaninsula JLT2003 TaxID=1231392 RepID=K2HDT2_9RHOB|nr:ParB/RepB/Spo0J family partition protein [Oceaniovalibus guishaninsula]EKE44667.1 chromosome partitioning protein parB [Oceaniovalibus guishaninsula JLT2003]